MAAKTPNNKTANTTIKISGYVVALGCGLVLLFALLGAALNGTSVSADYLIAAVLGSGLSLALLALLFSPMALITLVVVLGTRRHQNPIPVETTPTKLADENA
jgi:hypothetical protein